MPCERQAAQLARGVTHRAGEFFDRRQPVAKRHRGIADSRRDAPLCRIAQLALAARIGFERHRAAEALETLRDQHVAQQRRIQSPSSAACRRGAPLRGQSMRALRTVKLFEAAAFELQRRAAAREFERRRAPSPRRGMSLPAVASSANVSAPFERCQFTAPSAPACSIETLAFDDV